MMIMTTTFMNTVHRRLFNGLRDTVLTLLVGSIVIYVISIILKWLFFNSVGPWQSGEVCEINSGACWPFLKEKLRLILFGTYPFDLQWRPLLASVLLLASVGVSMVPAFQKKGLIYFWLVIGLLYLLLMRGGVLGLEYVPSQQWNGLPILLMLALFGLALAFPLGVLLGLLRHQDNLPALKGLATVYIEIIRGVPMIMVLFLGVFILPLMMPAGVNLDPLVTTMVALVFFHSAYFAEAIRGGLQSVPKGQYEAADSQGFSYTHKIRFVVLPQAIKKSMPGIMNTVLGAYKDTSLVVIIGIHDIMATAKMAFSDPEWQRYGLEAYMLIGVWYLVTCWVLSSYSRWLERRVSQ
jgi:general L-amino acid transport system permease protein